MSKYVLGLGFTKPTPESFKFSGCYTGIDGSIRGELELSVREAEPPRAGEYYTMSTFNVKNLPTNGDYTLDEGVYYRNLLVFDILDYDRVSNYLSVLMNRCAEVGNVWKVFEQYAESEDEADTTSAVLRQRKKDLNCAFTVTWGFEEGRTIQPLQEMYDERIIVEISWIFEGQSYLFRGYWYVTSISFIAERMKQHDPYYRRYMLLMEKFNAHEIEKYLLKEVDYLRLLEHEERGEYLYTHFEYDGQEMFYER